GPLALYRQRRVRMGTLCDIRVWSRSACNASQALGAAFSEVERIEQVFSAYRPDSELSLVNRESAEGPVTASKEFFSLTEYAMTAWKDSGGIVDISIGPLMRAWGIRGNDARIPTVAELDEARGLVGCDKVQLSKNRRSIRFARAGMCFDFGGL